MSRPQCATMEPPDNVLNCLKTLLEGVSRAVIKQKPEDIAGFLASYFQEFIDFQKENPNLILTEVVEKFDFKQGKIILYSSRIFSDDVPA